MKIGWFLIALIWVVPIGSMLACPYDLHGLSTCSSAAQAGRIASLYVAAPGLWLGTSIGGSFPAVVLGVVYWLLLLSLTIFYVAKALASHASR